METRVIITEHAQGRIPQRGDNIVNVISEVGASSSQIFSASVRSRDRRVALVSPRLKTVPVIEVSPRTYGIGFVVVTALPRQSSRPIPHPIVAVA